MKRFALLAAPLLILAACSDTETVTETVDASVEATAQTVEAAVAELSADQDISTMPAGTYTDEDGHAYIAFSYSHQGYSNPILRFNGDAFEAKIELNPTGAATSTLTVDIDPAMIDSGVGDFNEHLVSADFFDVENHPDIRFVSTSLSMEDATNGTLIGDLTMKGVTKPVVLDVTLNKVGENFRSKTPMFGISATGAIKRSDFDLGKYAPMVGDDVDLMIEVEFQKAE